MQRYAPFMAGLGIVALVCAVLSFGIQVLSGVVVLDGFDFYFTIANAGVGIGLLIAAATSSLEGLGHWFRMGGSARRASYGANSLIQAVLGLLILGVLAYLSTLNEFSNRWDWTEAERHSLSAQTLELLSTLEPEVRVTAIFPGALAQGATPLLERYELADPDGFHWEIVDPQRQPTRLAQLGVDPTRVAAGLLHVAIGEETLEVSELSEEGLTNALIKLTRLERKKVYVLDGHNEAPVEGEEASTVAGFADAAIALENENYSVEALLLVAQGEVPDDADVVIVAGPTRPLHSLELQALERWVGSGGALFVMLDPRANTNLYEPLAKWGVSVGNDMIVDRVQGMFGQPLTPIAGEYADHEITRALRDITVYQQARSVEPVEGNSDLGAIVRTSEAAWAERDLARLFETGEAEPGEGDLIGRVPLAVAGEVRGEDSEPARLVVFGDSDFARNGGLGQFLNRDLFLNSVNWLLGDVEAISIRPATGRASRLDLSQEQFETVRVLALFVVPELIAILGVLAWWQRRRAPGR